MFMNSTIKIRLFILLLFLPLINVFPSGTPEDFDRTVNLLYAKTVPLIYPEELTALLDRETPLLLDIRTIEEFRISHLKNARFADYESFDISLFRDIPEDRIIVVYCSVGYRSERIGERFLREGFSRVYNLYGGLFYWVNKGYPVYDRRGITRKIHGYSKDWGRLIKKGEVIY